MCLSDRVGGPPTLDQEAGRNCFLKKAPHSDSHNTDRSAPPPHSTTQREKREKKLALHYPSQTGEWDRPVPRGAERNGLGEEHR